MHGIWQGRRTSWCHRQVPHHGKVVFLNKPHFCGYNFLRQLLHCCDSVELLSKKFMDCIDHINTLWSYCFPSQLGCDPSHHLRPVVWTMPQTLNSVRIRIQWNFKSSVQRILSHLDCDACMFLHSILHFLNIGNNL